MSSPIKSTIAFRVTRQFIDHMYGGDKFLSKKGFMNIFRVFRNLGGSWESVIRGDLQHIEILKDTIESYFEVKQHAKKYGLI